MVWLPLLPGPSVPALLWPKCALIVSNHPQHPELIDALALSGFHVHCEETVAGALAFMADVSVHVAIVGPLSADVCKGIEELVRGLKVSCEHLVLNLDPGLLSGP